MSVATRHWNDTITRFVIEQYSQPFDLLYDCFTDSSVASEISLEMLRALEPAPQNYDPYSYIQTIDDNMIQLICMDADRLISLDHFELKKVLQQALRTLTPGGYCVFIASDKLYSGKIIPTGFQLAHRFLANGFKVVSIYDKSSSHLPFKLSSHQYLAVFQKPIHGNKRLANIISTSSRVSIV